jgi:hypothetical protein
LRGSLTVYPVHIGSFWNGSARLTRAEQEQGMAAYNAFTESLKKSGAFIGSNRL